MQQIIGRLIDILPVISGESANGSWQRGGFVIEVGSEYPRKVAFTTFGNDNAIVNASMLNRTVQVSYRPESREYNERWYTDLKATKVGVFQAQPPQVTVEPVQPTQAAMPTDDELFGN